MRHGNLTVIGTSHIAKDSVSRVKDAILADKPQIVAVELDHARLHSLLAEEKPRLSPAMLRMMGATGFVFFIIASFLQRRLGKLIGAVPGQEMKTAVQIAQQNKARVALIDQPLNITMRNLSRISIREKLKLARDLIFGVAGIGTEKVPFDLAKTPSAGFVGMAMKKVKQRYPGLYKALVADRNEYMANALARIIRTEPESRVVAVVGAGHEKEVIRLLKANIVKKENE
ncbi:TraB/GumN family protein [Candidatus Woesearchaeota archaeon]|nr:TraB/GumN family protein [Candidatus Woesearchaeota archaeon]